MLCYGIDLTTVFGRGVDSEDDWVRERLREVDLGVRQRPLPRRHGLLLADEVQDKKSCRLFHYSSASSSLILNILLSSDVLQL